MLHQEFKNKIVSITGATGFVGRHLTGAFIDAGADVEILTRKPMSSLPPDWQTKITAVHGDLFNLNRFGENADYVFHLAVEQYNKNLMRQTNVLGTENLVEHLAQNSKLKKFIFLSSVGVFGNRFKEKIIDENADCKPRNPYEKSKYEAETYIKKQTARGFPAVIVRPSIIYGPNARTDNNFYRIVRAINRGYFYFIGKQKSFYNIIYIEDVIRALFKIILLENQGNYKIFTINEPIEWRELALLVQKKLGLNNKIRAIPKAVGIVLSVLGSAARKLKLPSALTYTAYKIITCPSVYGTKNIECCLADEEKIGNARGIAETIDYMKSTKIV